MSTSSDFVEQDLVGDVHVRGDVSDVDVQRLQRVEEVFGDQPLLGDLSVAVVRVANRGERQRGDDRDDPGVFALLFLLYFLEGLADHHRPPADRLVVVRARREVAIDVKHRLAADDGGRGLGAGAERRRRRFDREGDARAVGAQCDRQRAVDRGAIDPAAVREHAVAALTIVDDPAAVLDRHLHVLAADAAVVDPHVAVELAADQERPDHAELAAVERADGQPRRDRRPGRHAVSSSSPPGRLGP